MLTKENHETRTNQRLQASVPTTHSVCFNGQKFVCDESGDEVHGKKGDLINFTRSHTVPPRSVTITFQPGIVVHGNGSPLPDNKITVLSGTVQVKIVNGGNFTAPKDPTFRQDTAEGKIIINGMET